MTVGMARVTVFQEIRPGAGFKTDYFVNEMLRGYRKTIQRDTMGYSGLEKSAGCAAPKKASIWARV